MAYIHKTISLKMRHLIRLGNLLAVVILAACQVLSTPSVPSPAPTSQGDTSTPTPGQVQAMVTFQVKVPDNTPASSTVILTLLDEVTGLPYNTTSYQMKNNGSGIFELKLPFPLNSLVDYRYEIGSNPRVSEYTSEGEAVRNRQCLVPGPETIQDVISAWQGTSFSGQTGTIEGVVLDSSDQSPVPGAMVSAGGQRISTLSDGSFLIDHLPEGIHNVVVTAPDGKFQYFQQGAKVLAGKITEARIPVLKSKLVSVTFLVKPPKENVVGLPIRMAGNLEILGDTFTDLAGGVSIQASRAPLLTQKPDGTYSLTLKLPAGFDLRYKYTLGDGFWNTELTGDGKFRVRQLIIPDHDTEIQDAIQTWRSPKLAPVTFDITVPDNTPTGDTVSIQFNPYAWMAPLPMWSMGGNRWVYILFGPQHLVSQVKYRFCRNDQCDVNPAAQGDGSGMVFTPSDKPQTIQKQISSWTAWQGKFPPTRVAAAEIHPRGEGFMAGFEASPGYQPSWEPYLPSTFDSIHRLGANWVLITPTLAINARTAAEAQPRFFLHEPWDEIQMEAKAAQNQGLHVALFPQVVLYSETNYINPDILTNPGWLESFMSRYQEYLINYADLATQSGIKAIVIDLPGEISPPWGEFIKSSVEPRMEEIWLPIIQKIRAHFAGSIIWAVNPGEEMEKHTSFYQAFDQIYVTLPLSGGDDPLFSAGQGVQGLQTELQTLDAFHSSVKKPIILGLAFPAIDESDPCSKQPSPGCNKSDFEPATTAGLAHQVDYYNTVFSEINTRDWIAGVFSCGYYLPEALQDRSISVHGKPAEDVLWYWFPRMLAEN